MIGCGEGEHLSLIRNFLIVAWLSLLAVNSVRAQEAGPRQLPDALGTSSRPSPPAVRHEAVVLHKKVYWALVGVDAASAVADAQISRAGLQMYPTIQEKNSWLYGRRPSLGRYYATDVVTDAGSAFLSYRLLHSRRRPLRILGLALPAAMAGMHADGAIRWAILIEDHTPSGQSHPANRPRSQNPPLHLQNRVLRLPNSTQGGVTCMTGSW